MTPRAHRRHLIERLKSAARLAAVFLFSVVVWAWIIWTLSQYLKS